MQPIKSHLTSDAPANSPAGVAMTVAKLELNEVLLVKLAPHMRPLEKEIVRMLEIAFKQNNAHERILIYYEGDMAFNKMVINK